MPARPGDVIADRFELLERAGAGGMGVVFRALDRVRRVDVALKMFEHAPTVHGARRFALETELLAQLDHPAVVRYVAHGVSRDGDPFLAMEWLDGEDLARRLERGPLRIDETIALVRGAADALASAHARGVIHRDVKPTNLFLRKRDPAQVVVLDFGIARSAAHSVLAPITRTGMLVGTPGYIAPEQARGSRALDARADVFALGCVAFECLAGTPAFAADDVMAILAKVLLDEPAPLCALRPDVPAALEALVARMLAKDAEQRPADGRAVVLALEALAEGEAPPPRVPALTHREQRVVCVVLAAPSGDVTAAATLTPEHAARTRERVQRAVAPAGVDAIALADGSIVAVVDGAGAATDLALRGARCALAIRAALSDDAAVAMCTGRAAVDAGLPLGDAIDRVARLVRQHPHAPGVVLDDTSAALLSDRFEIEAVGAAHALGVEREAPSTLRTLLGRPSVFVGRDAEIATLEAALAQCIDEPIARAVLVTGTPGVGKSRLAHEMIGRARAHASVLVAHCDPLAAGSTFAVAAQLVRRAAGVTSGAGGADAHERLHERLASIGEDAWAARTAELLGELIGAPAPGEPSPQLRSARGDPRLLGDRMRHAWSEWIAAECAAGPIMLVLEDLQWGDLPSVRCIDDALGRLVEAPLMVVALARPEVHEAFPRLWNERGAQELRLGPLPRRASEKLVRAALGEDVSRAAVSDLTARAGGNAFFLEELIRAATSGRGDSLPDSVLAVAQARLDRLAPNVRRALRAASVFGEVFWREAVQTVIGAGDAASAIGALVEAEVVDPSPTSRFTGRSEHRFRHAFLRDAAYASLTDDDRRVAHALAGAWLESEGERDALALAEHFERGGALERALPYLRRAAEQAYEGSDMDRAIALAERAIECGARGEVLGFLRRLQSNAHVWQTDFARGLTRGLEAFSLLAPGTGPWFGAGTDALYAAPGVGDFAHVDALVEAMRDRPLRGPLTAEYGLAVLNGITALAWAGRSDGIDSFVARVPSALIACEGQDPAAAGWLHCARSVGEGILAGEPEPALSGAIAAATAFEQAGDVRGAATAEFLLGSAWFGLGQYARAVEMLREARGAASRHGLHFVSAMATILLATTLNRSGAVDVALEELETLTGTQSRLLRGLVRACAAAAWLAKGDLDRALPLATESFDLLGPDSPGAPRALAVLIALRRGDLQTARREAEVAFEALARVRPFNLTGEAEVTLVYVEAMAASGELARARDAAAAGARRIERRAAKIEDPALRASYLESVPVNARLLARAREWSETP